MDNKNCNSKTPTNEQERSTVYRVDETKYPRTVKVDLPTPDQFGLKTSEQIEDFRKSIKQGSGKVVEQD